MRKKEEEILEDELNNIADEIMKGLRSPFIFVPMDEYEKYLMEKCKSCAYFDGQHCSYQSERYCPYEVEEAEK